MKRNNHDEFDLEVVKLMEKFKFDKENCLFFIRAQLCKDKDGDDLVEVISNEAYYDELLIESFHTHSIDHKHFEDVILLVAHRIMEDKGFIKDGKPNI